MKISTGIELMIDSFRNSVVENQVELKKLPVIIDFKKDLKIIFTIYRRSTNADFDGKQFENCLLCQEKLVGAKDIVTL
ncbi:MAG: hypothetical protein IJ688_08320 [Treponema sp.]|nr:hypothetical protein [Treponema sp.]